MTVIPRSSGQRMSVTSVCFLLDCFELIMKNSNHPVVKSLKKLLSYTHPCSIFHNLMSSPPNEISKWFFLGDKISKFYPTPKQIYLILNGKKYTIQPKITNLITLCELIINVNKPCCRLLMVFVQHSVPSDALHRHMYNIHYTTLYKIQGK